MGKITEKREHVIAEVTALPDEVSITLTKGEAFLTPEQALSLAAELEEAARSSRTLDWSDDAEPKLVPRSTT